MLPSREDTIYKAGEDVVRRRDIFDLGYDDLQCTTTSSSRVYHTPNGRKYPSITHILGLRSREFIQNWRAAVGEEEANRVSRVAAIRGTKVHNLLESYVLGEEVRVPSTESSLVTKPFRQIKEVLDKNLTGVLATETPLYSDHLRTAGRVDLVGEWNGRNAIVDFKTAKRAKNRKDAVSYFIQCAAYAIMFEERTGIAIPTIVVIIGSEVTSEARLFVERRDDWVPHLRHAINQYDKAKLFGHI